MAKLKGSVWAALPTPLAAVDEEEMKRLFTVKPVNSGGATPRASKSMPATPRGGQGKKVMLLDLKRSNQISIALAKFKSTHEALRDAVLRLDEALIKPEDIQKLVSTQRGSNSGLAACRLPAAPACSFAPCGRLL